MKYDVRAAAIAAGLLWGGVMLLVGIISMVNGYGEAFVHAMGSVYLGYQATPGGVFIGTLWGLIDGAIAGALFAWLYNWALKK